MKQGKIGIIKTAIGEVLIGSIVELEDDGEKNGTIVVTDPIMMGTLADGRSVGLAIPYMIGSIKGTEVELTPARYVDFTYNVDPNLINEYSKKYGSGITLHSGSDMPKPQTQPGDN